MSRCFRTDAEGRIALRHDWPALFHALVSLDCVAFQSRHAYARFVHFTRFPILTWDADGLTARDDEGCIHFRCDGWQEAWGRIAICECCGTVGRIELRNRHGAEFLQICPGLEVRPGAWAACLESLVNPCAQRPSGTALVPAHAADDFPAVPANARVFAATSASLARFLSVLEDAAVPVRFTLRTPEATHIRTFVPKLIENSYPLLTVGHARTSLQIAQPCVRALALDSADACVHVAGPDDALLATLGPDDAGREAWFDALHAAFPELN